MEDEKTKGLDEVMATENAPIKNFEELVGAKRKEVVTLQGQIKVKVTRSGDPGLEVSGMENDLENPEPAGPGGC
eukprot:14344720-Heterocapsa_arctica.AAC.1